MFVVGRFTMCISSAHHAFRTRSPQPWFFGSLSQYIDLPTAIPDLCQELGICFWEEKQIQILTSWHVEWVALTDVQSMPWTHLASWFPVSNPPETQSERHVSCLPVGLLGFAWAAAAVRCANDGAKWGFGGEAISCSHLLLAEAEWEQLGT